jgi:lactate 2-monooxygenase
MAATKSADTAQLLHDDHNPAPTAPATYQRMIYASLRPPLFSTDPAQWEALAQRKVPRAHYLYVAGNAGQGSTYAANRAAFDRYRIRPRMLVDATKRDLSVQLFGKTYASPLLVAPIGVQAILHKDAEEATARACKQVGVPMILSTAASRTIEEVAAANGDAERWFQVRGLAQLCFLVIRLTFYLQLYWPKPADDDITASLLARAQAAGYTTLVVTADTFSLGWRPADLDTAFLPFVWGIGCQVGFSDPAFRAKYARAQARDARRPFWDRFRETFTQLLGTRRLWTIFKLLWYARTVRRARAWLDVVHSSTYRTWPDLVVLRKHWHGPIVLKGVQTVADAHAALDAGLDGIVVSNHGGRQVDGAVASLDALAAITTDERVRNSDLAVLFDSGVRSGADAIKALALGARAVLVGRPFAYGLAIAGQAGVEHVLRCTLADLDNTLGLMGKMSVGELGKEDLEIVSRSA